MVHGDPPPFQGTPGSRSTARVGRMAVSAATFAVLLTLAACDAGGPSGPSASETRVGPTVSATEPVVPAPREENCGDEPWSTRNPAYEGPGPHLIAPVDIRSHLPESVAVGIIPTDLDDPGYTWYFGGDESVLTNPMTDKDAQVQLLACIEPTKGDGPIGKVECHFDNVGFHPFPLYEADYEVTVREARTGRVVHTLSVPGTVKGRDNCPTHATETGDTVLLRALSRDRLVEALRPLSTAPARR